MWSSAELECDLYNFRYPCPEQRSRSNVREPQAGGMSFTILLGQVIEKGHDLVFRGLLFSPDEFAYALRSPSIAKPRRI